MEKIESVEMEDPINTEIFSELVEIYKSGEPLYDNTLYSNEHMTELSEKIKNIDNEHDADYIGAIQLELLQSRERNHSASSTGIQLNPKEKCCFKTKNSILNTAQKLSRTINYSGFRYNVGGYRTGTMTLHSNDIEGFRSVDGGCFYITNQRLIFNGYNNHNKVVALGKILSFAPYEDTAVLINIANSSPIIINFSCTGMFNISSQGGLIFFMDDRLHCLYALDEVLEERRKAK